MIEIPADAIPAIDAALRVFFRGATVTYTCQCHKNLNR